MVAASTEFQVAEALSITKQQALIDLKDTLDILFFVRYSIGDRTLFYMRSLIVCRLLIINNLSSDDLLVPISLKKAKLKPQ